MRVLEIIWEIFFCSFFSSLFRFFCVKRSDGVTSCPGGSHGSDECVCAISYLAPRLDVS
jgi:hypothetical protein